MFQIRKYSCQWLLRYECLKNFVVKLLSEGDLIFYFDLMVWPYNIVLCDER